MSEAIAPTSNNHHQEDVEQLEKLVSEIQSEPKAKPQRRRRRTKAQIEAAAATVSAKPQQGISVKVQGLAMEGDAKDIALLFNAMQEAG